MKAGKAKKNSAAPIPTDSPKAKSLKRNVAGVVAGKRAKPTPMREPSPQAAAPAKKKPIRAGLKAVAAAPKRAIKTIRAKLSKVAGAKKPTRALAKEPAPQPAALAATKARVKSVAPVLEPVAHVQSKPNVAAPVETVAAPTVTAPVIATGPSIPGPPAPKPRPARQPRTVPGNIPSLLLEPDHLPNEPLIAGPGARFALTPEKRSTPPGQPEELPESYSTQQIFLAAQDPYWLFASWDLDAKQRARYNAESASGALTIRLRRGFVEGPIQLEVHTLPTSRDWFIEVDRPDTTFVAELGYHEKNSGAWRRISISKPATTPRDRVVQPLQPPSIETKRSSAPAASRAPAAIVLPEGIVFGRQPPAPEPQRTPPPQVQPRRTAPAKKSSPAWKKVQSPRWSTVQAKALDELISLEFRHIQQGSLEIEELLRRRVLRTEEEAAAPSSLDLQKIAEEEFSPAAEMQPEAPSSIDLAMAQEARKEFWFKVNAELIIYGSTEPDAHVSIGGRAIRLREDGSFSYRFALPDGAYELPVIALSREGDDGRAAELHFLRETRYAGEVGEHPRDPALKAPAVDNL